MEKFFAEPSNIDSSPSELLGWREWVALPELRIDHIKVKVDTGAQTSALHADQIKYVKRDGKRFVTFVIHPFQRRVDKELRCEAEVIDRRHVRSSSGHRSLRPVILTELRINKRTWKIELTLVNRDVMGFRMLLGREAIRGRFCVDPARSFVLGKRKSLRGRS